MTKVQLYKACVHGNTFKKKIFGRKPSLPDSLKQCNFQDQLPLWRWSHLSPLQSDSVFPWASKALLRVDTFQPTMPVESARAWLAVLGSVHCACPEAFPSIILSETGKPSRAVCVSSYHSLSAEWPHGSVKGNKLEGDMGLGGGGGSECDREGTQKEAE